MDDLKVEQQSPTKCGEWFGCREPLYRKKKLKRVKSNYSPWLNFCVHISRQSSAMFEHDNDFDWPVNVWLCVLWGYCKWQPPGSISGKKCWQAKAKVNKSSKVLLGHLQRCTTQLCDDSLYIELQQHIQTSIFSYAPEVSSNMPQAAIRLW